MEVTFVGKLVDILHRAGKASTASIGFAGRPQAASKPKAAAIVASVGTEAGIDAVIKAGADIVVVPQGMKGDAAKAAEAAWGVDARRKERLSVADLRALHEQGADFVLLPQSVSMRVLSETVEHLERALIIAPPQDDPLLVKFRGHNLLEIDVAVIDAQLSAKELASMQIEQFVQVRQLSETLRFPTVLTVREMPAAEDIRTLARLGAQGIWVADAGADQIAQLREALEQIPRDKETPSVAFGPITGGGQSR